jgi:hypothetical protein
MAIFARRMRGFDDESGCAEPLSPARGHYAPGGAVWFNSQLPTPNHQPQRALGIGSWELGVEPIEPVRMTQPWE